MGCRSALILGAMLALGAVGSPERASAQAIGCSRMPSTMAQYFGYCYGAGHHVPIVKTPWQHPHRVQRLVLPPAACGPLVPAPYVFYGCYGGCPSAADTPLPPAPTPLEASLVMPGYRLATRYDGP